MANATDQEGISDPNPESPEIGRITFGGELISEVAYWVEDGDHLFRSTEFDVYAADPDRATAIGKFIDNVDDLGIALAAWTDQDLATGDDMDACVTLLRRMTAAYRAVSAELTELQAEQERHIIQVNLPRRRRRGAHTRGGYERSPLASSLKRQPV
jgi:hypothetical protein